MCGIVGAWQKEESVVDLLVDGLRILEYRGYDSAGVGIANGQAVHVRRRKGRIEELEKVLELDPPSPGVLGVGHTRWATHGEPSDKNAHPHADPKGRFALVHNGTIENHQEIRRELLAEGAVFLSETDTEVLTLLVARELDRGHEPFEALRRSLGRVEGNYAVALSFANPEPRLLGARHGPPLCVAVTDAGAYLASDVLALLPFSRDVVFLEDGDLVDLRPGSVRVAGLDGQAIERPIRHVDWDAEAASREGYPHFMLKEIHEQPDVLERVNSGRLDLEAGDVRLEGELWEDDSLRAVQRVQVVGCGTALHAGYIARYLIEGLAGIPVDCDYASEFRYRDPRLVEGTLTLAISQSGETADTLAALRLAREKGSRIATLCNALGSSMVRESDAAVLIHAGPEIGVASTKAFLAMLAAATQVAVRLGRARGTLSAEAARSLLGELHGLPAKVQELLDPKRVESLRTIASGHLEDRGFLFLGRGVNYPVALEGALKLKEISYVHAEGYPAGEMKHGPIALIEPGLTTLVVNARGAVADKVRSNIEQVRARGGSVIVVGSDPESLAIGDEQVPIPDCSEWLSPILNVIPLQLFSYHVADLRGCDIDKPRNLAKSVTVE